MAGSYEPQATRRPHHRRVDPPRGSACTRGATHEHSEDRCVAAGRSGTGSAVVPRENREDLDGSFAGMAREQPGGLLIAPDPRREARRRSRAEASASNDHQRRAELAGVPGFRRADVVWRESREALLRATIYVDREAVMLERYQLKA